MDAWTKVGENLVRHWAGQIYLRAKVGGKAKRISLQTSDLRIAKMKRDDLLSGMRKASASEHQTGAVRTLGEAIDAVSTRILEQPQLRPQTITYCGEMIKILKDKGQATASGG